MILQIGDARLMSRPIPLPSIQILRALAATLVVVGHAFHDSGYVAAQTARTAIDFPYFDWGFGVDIFFVISGFIMIYTTADSFGEPGAASTFLKRRFIRIAPLYWLMTAALIAVSVIAPRFLNVQIENWHSIVTSYLFIPDIRGNGEVRPILAAGWTLNYEMFFYTIFACCLTLPLRRGVLWLVGFFVAISTIGASAALPGNALPFWTNSIVLEFVLGVLIGLACRAHWSLSGAQALTLTAGAIISVIAMGPTWGCDQTLPRFICDGIPAALLIAAAALGPRLSPTRLVAFLVAVGDASYSLYLTHPFVLRPLRNIWVALDGGALPLALYVLVCIPVAVTGALILYRLIEKPLTGALQRRMRGPARPRGGMIAIPNPAPAPLNAP
jgi:exopolysaccharide production protein ExoZ